MRSAEIAIGMVALLLAASCQTLEAPPLDDHVVEAPISVRANIVLQNLVTEYGSDDGRWRADMSPGCAEIWASQFGYRAGLRRDRDDLVALGEATADRVSSDVRGLALDALFGDVDHRDPALYGFPALLVSSTLGGSDVDGLLFAAGLGRIEDLVESGTLDQRERAGLATLLAEVARLDPEESEDHLALARRLAEEATGAGRGTWESLAWAAIARASGLEEDVARARQALDTTAYRFHPETGVLLPLEATHEMLSRHLAYVHALADLASVTGDPQLRTKALAVLDRLFSDDWFDGRFLIHDRVFGPSRSVCSGCNFQALYLVDRLYGDAFVIDPVPPLPERGLREETEEEAIHTILLGPGTAEHPGRLTATIEGLPPHGKLRFRHASQSAWVGFVYEVVDSERLPPRGGVHALIPLWMAPFPLEREAGFDEEGTARFASIGNVPLDVDVDVTRRQDGRLDMTIRLSGGD